MTKRMNVVLNEILISLFPSLHTVTVTTEGNHYRFRLEALLETMKSLSPSLTVFVEDRGSGQRNQ